MKSKWLAKGVGAVAIALLTVGLIGSPATASPTAFDTAPEATTAAVTPAFRIYYSPNCSNASRYYSGQNFGEAWINDTFNSGASLAGYGQRIRNNAASVRIYNASLYISSAADEIDGTPSFFRSVASGCFNLADFGLRNNNTSWITMYYVP